MEVVNKKGEVIKTDPSMVSHDEFINLMKSFKEIRVGVGGGDAPFTHIFLKASKKEIKEVVRSNQMDVTYSIMYNSKMNDQFNTDYYDILYIDKMRSTLLDKPKNK